ncbi:hypothetical protein DSO57_1017912 [Entomophthora muscae]|uniref:Uncharacterized protein n=1 Tax=Entomophthora muscae TaxID=34485 RepID=A0ACC2S6J9_9FUNG|nr:hypothetical protein DSO57_1017912 [Entomophthora muscae]
MSVLVGIGLVVFAIYSLIYVSAFSVSYHRKKRKPIAVEEIAVIYREKTPLCVGVLHTSGNVLLPGSCVNPMRSYHVAFLKLSNPLPTAYPTTNIYPAKSLTVHSGYTSAKDIGYNIALLQLDSNITQMHRRFPIAKSTSATSAKMGWSNCMPSSSKYCTKPMYSNWFNIQMPYCQQIPGENCYMEYPLGYVEFVSSRKKLMISSFNAPPIQIFNTSVSTYTSLAAFASWIDSSLHYI